LTASAGIACNCRLAKVASDMNKPDGQFMVVAREEEILDFVRGLSIRKVGGVGNVSEQLLNAIGVYTCKHIYEKRAEIKLLFSEISYEFYMEVSQGLGATCVEPPDERERKSISTETTFADTADRKVLVMTCRQLCRDLARDLANKDILGSAVTVKIKSHDFKLKSKVGQVVEHTNNEIAIFESAEKTLFHLLDTASEKPLKLRLMGVRMTDLKDKADVKGAKQTSLRTYMAAKTAVQGEASKKYSCPICETKFSAIKLLNDHIDQCISFEGEINEKLPRKDSETLSIESAQNYAQLVCDGAEMRLQEETETKKQLETQLKTTDDVSDHVISPPSTSVSPDSLSEMSNPPSLENHPERFQNNYSAKDFVCPVCSASLRLDTEEEMSKHVEDCLSQQEVAAIVKEEKSAIKLTDQTCGKRKLSELGTVNTGKRIQVGKIARIDSFFAKC